MSESASQSRRRLQLWLGAAALGGIAAAWGGFRLKVRSGITAVARGEKVAMKAGCFACHGMGGEAGIPNPGGEEKTVPSWTGGTAMMYILKPGELDEWVLDGHPERLAGRARDEQAIRMPAYRNRISRGDYADLRTYLRAVMGLDYPESGEAKAGYEIAAASGCFGCHGPSGRGLRANPRSLAGYIPGWEGGPYADMVKNDAELEEWIRTGTSKRLERNPLARHFMVRQVVRMPAYEGKLKPEEIRRIIAYIHWLRDGRTGRPGEDRMKDPDRGR